MIDGVDSGVKAVAKDGDRVEFKINETHIQWKYDGSQTWNDLVKLTDLKGDRGENGASGTVWYSGEGSPIGNSSIIARIGDYYFDTLNGTIYEYVNDGSSSLWKFKVDLNSQKKLVLEDGVYTGKLDNYEFDLTVEEGIFGLFIHDFPVDYNAEYEINGQVLNIILSTFEGEESIVTTYSYTLNGNRLTAYCEDSELQLLKGTYFDFESSNYASLTLSEKDFALFYEGRAFRGMWEVNNVNDEEEHKIYELVLRDDKNMKITVEVSYFSRSVVVTSFECDFTQNTYKD